MVKLLFNIKIQFFKILGIKNSPLNSNVAPRFKRQNMKKKKKDSGFSEDPRVISKSFPWKYELLNGHSAWHKLKVCPVSQI